MAINLLYNKHSGPEGRARHLHQDQSGTFGGELVSTDAVKTVSSLDLASSLNRYTINANTTCGASVPNVPVANSVNPKSATEAVANSVNPESAAICVA